MVSVMYDLLDGLISAQHEHKKLPILKSLNVKLDILRCYTQLLFNFKLLDKQICEFVDVLINQIGNQLGGWIRQREKEEDDSTEK